jgi:hypothetical protein
VCAQDDSVLLIWGLFEPMQPLLWCVAKVNSLGCTSKMQFAGQPSASSSQPFQLIGAKVLNQKFGLLMYGFVPQFAPFQGGSLCIASPLQRVGPFASGGNPPPSDCSGALTFDFNALIQSGVDPTLVQGAIVYAQYWYRDPASIGGSGLTNAVQFQIGP